MFTALVIGGPIVVVLVWGFLLDRRSRRRGDALRSSDQIQASIRQTRGEVRASDQILQLRPFREQGEKQGE
ncbi:MAG TPA: hypothetical protein VJ914_29055 [Pseudonocardiaceae bacterium]|nr:hypothetical protein [Pseudonocardiaceae bacterium]